MDRHSPRTRLTLIGALARGLRWEEFIALYGRIIFHWARFDFGLQHSDADNLRQEVLVRVWRGIGGYDAGKGRFRAWLYACTRNAVRNLHQSRDRFECIDSDIADPRFVPASGSIFASDLEDQLRRLEEEGFCGDSLQAAVRSVRNRVHAASWRAFLLFEFFEMRAKEIASLVDLSPAAVNQAVYRVRRLFQEELTREMLPAPERRSACS